MSVADVVDADSLTRMRAYKKAAKAAVAAPTAWTRMPDVDIGMVVPVNELANSRITSPAETERLRVVGARAGVHECQTELTPAMRSSGTPLASWAQTSCH